MRRPRASARARGDARIRTLPYHGPRRARDAMTLDQLRIFVAVAERQHVTRAAEALNLVQSAVSAAINALESRHAVKLFHRVGRGIELTEAGGVFLGEARAVLARAQAAELVLADLSGMRRGTLAIQASQTIASHWLPRHLVAFRAAYPDIVLRLGIGNTAEAAEAVRAGRRNSLSWRARSTTAASRAPRSPRIGWSSWSRPATRWPHARGRDD